MFAELSGTREMRDSFNNYLGDFEVYNKLLKDKANNTEYQVDKIIREIGNQILEIQARINDIEHRISNLEREI